MQKKESAKMKILHKIYKHFTENLTTRKILGVVLGNVIIGIAVAGLAYSLMGNDPFTGCNMAISGGLGIGLGIYHLSVSCMILIIQLIWGRKYIGFGKVNLHWLKDYLRIGLFSGLQIFLDNFILLNIL